MRCPSCNADTVLTLDSRPVDNGRQRRRKCSGCGAQWRTMEAVVEGSLSVPRPEPAWRAAARAMRADGLALGEIARAVGQSWSMVQRVTAPAPAQRRAKRARAEREADPANREVANLKRRWRRQVEAVRNVRQADAEERT
jgi:transcriptional regulator NrdR family protein